MRPSDWLTNACRVRDGGKMVCMDPDMDVSTAGCVVFSFGVSSEVSFDVAVGGGAVFDILFRDIENIVDNRLKDITAACSSIKTRYNTDIKYKY